MYRYKKKNSLYQFPPTCTPAFTLIIGGEGFSGELGKVVLWGPPFHQGGHPRGQQLPPCPLEHVLRITVLGGLHGHMVLRLPVKGSVWCTYACVCVMCEKVHVQGR